MAVAATGFFDGVHLGHRRVIETLVRTAKARGDESLVITFWPHPRIVLQKDAESLRLLTSLDEKISLLHEMGVDRVEVVDFTQEFSNLTAKEYLRDIVNGRYGADAVLIGYDNRIGSDQASPARAVRIAESLGMTAIRVDAVDVVSSTDIRRVISEGRVDVAARLMGREYSYKGIVVPGKQLGRTIGFPTANTQGCDSLKIMPSRGVYFTRTEVNGKEYQSMTNVGDIVETHIFDFSEDIYGQEVKIKFVRRLRDERIMKSLDELKAQLAIDEATCRSLF